MPSSWGQRIGEAESSRERGDRAGAEAILREVVDSGHPIYRQQAAMTLGGLHLENFELLDAWSAFRIAADGPDPGLTGRAQLLLAHASYMLADAAEAHAARDAALASGDPDVVEDARQLDLRPPDEIPPDDFLEAADGEASRLLADDREDEAESIALRLKDVGHPYYSSMAAIALYAIYGQRAEYAAAARMAEHVIALGHPDQVAPAFQYLGDALSLLGDPERAVHAYRTAAQDPRPELRLPSLVSLGGQLAVLGEVDSAYATFQRVIDTGHPRYRLGALAGLADLLHEQGDQTGVKRAVRALAESEDPEFAPQAAHNLGVLLRDEGDLDGAVQAFRQAAESGDPDWAPPAAHELSRLTEPATPPEGPAVDEPQEVWRLYQYAQGMLEAGDRDEAKAAYHILLDSADVEVVGNALLQLGWICAEHEQDYAQACDWYLKAATSEIPWIAARAARNLGVAGRIRGDLEFAATWFRKAFELDDPGESPLAAAHLGEMYYEAGDESSAVEHYQYTLANTEDQELIAEAAYRVGEIRYRVGDQDRARDWLERATRTGIEPFAQQAADVLRQLGPAQNR